MKPNLIILILFVMSATAMTQDTVCSNDNKVIDDVIVGKVDRAAIQKGHFGEYFLKEYQAYNPEKNIIERLQGEIYNYSITIVLATWCHDSKEQVPRFIKILDMLNYDTRHVELIGIDKNKSTGQANTDNLNIERVPTMIFYMDDREIGRIIETPQITLEKDIYNIIIK